MRLGTEERGKMQEMFKSGIELITKYANGNFENIDLEGKKTIRYSDGSIE